MTKTQEKQKGREEKGKEEADFSKGLLPTVVVDRTTGRVLMLAFSSRESLELTLKKGQAHFFSRKRQKIWKKGEESGNIISVSEVFSDCDNDSFIFVGEPSGPTCHTLAKSCFFKKVEGVNSSVLEIRYEGENFVPGGGILFELERVIRERKKNPSEKSYTSSLFRRGISALVSKIMEEAGELCESAIKRSEKENGKGQKVEGGEKDSVVWETADLIYHILALLVYLDIPFEDVLDELMRRRKEK